MRKLIDGGTVLEKAKKAAGEPFGAALIVRVIEDAPEVKRSYRLYNEALIDKMIHTSFIDEAELEAMKKEMPELVLPDIRAEYELGDIAQVFEKVRVQVVEHQESMLMQVIREIGGIKYGHITVDKYKVLEAFQKATAVSPRQYGRCGNPMCYAELVRGQNYCSVCGQKIKWSMD